VCPLNPFKSVHEVLTDMFYGEGSGLFIFLCHVVIWSIAYKIICITLFFVGPFLMLFMIPVVITIFWVLVLVGIYKFQGEKDISRFKIGVPVCLAVFVLFNGIPKLFLGWFYPLIHSKFFYQQIYGGFIYHWYKFVNAINFFSEDVRIPLETYKLDLYNVQWVWMITILLGTWHFFDEYYKSELREIAADKQAIKEYDEQLEKDRLKVIADDKHREEVRIYNEEQDKLRKKALDKKKAQEKQAKDPDAWGSGFL
jgi:hypothetical protein